MNNFVKLSEVKEKNLMQEEMRRVNGGEVDQVVDPPPPTSGESTPQEEAITQDYG
jgi:hypothetical protein